MHTVKYVIRRGDEYFGGIKRKWVHWKPDIDQAIHYTKKHYAHDAIAKLVKITGFEDMTVEEYSE